MAQETISAANPVEVKRADSPVPSVMDGWRSLRTEMDRLFDRFTTGFGVPAFGGLFGAAPMIRHDELFSMTMPAVDITEDDAAYKLTVELPGMTEQQVDVGVSGDMLTIKGEKQQSKELKDKNYHMMERSYGSFRRSFLLPAGVDREKVAAVFADGLLTVTLPKSKQAQKKKIEVKTAH